MRGSNKPRWNVGCNKNTHIKHRHIYTWTHTQTAVFVYLSSSFGEAAQGFGGRADSVSELRQVTVLCIVGDASHSFTQNLHTKTMLSHTWLKTLRSQCHLQTQHSMQKNNTRSGRIRCAPLSSPSHCQCSQSSPCHSLPRLGSPACPALSTHTHTRRDKVLKTCMMVHT